VSVERKLTAILCADVHGYSRLMNDDEEATLRSLTSHREIIARLIELHHGRFVNSAGDSVLAEFASVVNAVQCGIEIQAALRAESAELPPDRRMQFRIGINLGDVIVDGDQIYGDGVNVASRLESLAQPGGICISGTVHEQVRDKLALVYEDAGEQAVKNIPRQVRVWRVRLDGAAPTQKKRALALRYWRSGLLSAAGLAILIGTIVLVQDLSLKPPQTTASIPPPPALALPDKPSIAVLPFTNMSGDREQEYFSDGITDDLITDLARLPGLFVIARESSFTYKGKPTKLQDVGRELGVKYVLGGSVRKAAERMRVNVQLADASTGAELWAERYDRPLRDVFALQDEIVHRIVTTMNLQIALAQQGVVITRTTENLEAYDDLLRGFAYLRSLTRDGNAKARQALENAIELDPAYSLAYALLGLNYWLGSVLSFDRDPDALERSLTLARQAITLDDSLALAHSVLAQTYLSKEQYEQALTEAQRCIALDANAAFGYSVLGAVLAVQGSPPEAIAAIEKAKRLDPRNAADYLWVEGWAYTFLGRWDKAIAALNLFLSRVPSVVWPHAWLAADYYSLGDQGATRVETVKAERLLGLAPSADGYVAVAYAFNAQGKLAQGLAAAEKGMRLYPKKRGILFQRVFAYTSLGRWEESLSALKSYVALYPGDIYAHSYLARDYSALGRLDEARAEAAEVERGLMLDANFATEAPRSYDTLAEVMNDTGRPMEALGAAYNSNQPDRVKLSYLYEQGRAYTQLGRWQEAIYSLKAYVANHPGEVWPRVDLAVDYIELGDENAARAEVAEILRLNPQFSLKMALAGEFPAQQERFAAHLRKAGLT
jgi:adenylate cyclase